MKFYDKKSVDKVFDMGRSHHVSDCKLQISRRKIGTFTNSVATAHDSSLRSETSSSSSSHGKVSIGGEPCALHLSGLKKGISDRDLIQHFERYGRVKSVEQSVKGRVKTGQGRIIFESESSVKKAFEATMCHRIKNSKISISIHRKGHDTKNDRDYRTTDPKPAHDSDGRWLFFEGFRSNIEEDDIARYFDTFGRVSKIMIKRNKQTGARTGQVSVKFDSSKSVQLLKDLVIDHHIKGCKIKLKTS